MIFACLKRIELIKRNEGRSASAIAATRSTQFFLLYLCLLLLGGIPC
jgi:hypothetical protein